MYKSVSEMFIQERVVCIDCDCDLIKEKKRKTLLKENKRVYIFIHSRVIQSDINVLLYTTESDTIIIQ
jgi:hypothetical protein